MNYESGLYSDCPAGCLEHEHCDSCGQGYEAVYHVPDWMWAKLHTRAPAGLLCPCCAVLLAYGAGMQLDRNGLLPALRAVRDHCLALATKEFECQVERVKQYTGKPEAGYEAGARGLAALFMGLIKNLDDAALLELAGVGQHRDRTSDGLRSMTDERLVSGQLSKESAEQVPAPASSQKYERWPVGEPKDYREGSTIAPPSGDPRVFPGLAAPASSWCSQCGQDLSARACGPTHALRANELAGAGNLAGTEPTPTQTPRGKAMSETAPASSLPRVEATAPSGRILFAANSLLDAHKERQAAAPAERCKWCTRELIAPEEHACYRAWEAGQRSGLAANPEAAERTLYDDIRRRACRHSPRCYSEAQCAGVKARAEEISGMCVGIAHIVKGCWPAALTPIVGDEMAEGVRTGHVLACLCIAEHIDAWQKKARLHESCPVCDTIFGPVNR